MVIQTTLADRDRAECDKRVELRDIAQRIERSSIVRVNASRERNEARIRLRDPGRVPCLLDGGADADKCRGARFPGASDYLVAVACEGFVREVGVAVDEAFHAVAARGYLCSIQRSTGPAM